MKIIIATGNPGKAREIRRILEPVLSSVEFVTLKDLDPVEEPEEHGKTFEENAKLKAQYYSRRLGHLALADDSGLEVKALEGKPGVYSARFAGPNATDLENNAKLLEVLRNVPEDQRAARYRAVVALASPDGQVITAEGQTEGVMVDEPRGHNGFGYDPHFFVPELNKTFAELSPEEKDVRSHRFRALDALLPKMRAFLAT